MNWLCLFAYQLKEFFVKFANQNFPPVSIFAYRETTNFLLTVQTWTFACILLLKVLNSIYYFLAFGWHFSSKPSVGDLTAFPPYLLAVETTHYIFTNHFCKDNSNPAIIIEEKTNPSIFKRLFFSRADPSILATVGPVIRLVKWIKLSFHCKNKFFCFSPQSTVSPRSGSSSEVDSSCWHVSDAWSYLEQRVSLA